MPSFPYRIFCNTEKRFVYALSLTSLTGCPNSYSHDVNTNSTTVDWNSVNNPDTNIINLMTGATGYTNSISGFPNPVISIGNSNATIDLTNPDGGNYGLRLPSIQPSSGSFFTVNGKGDINWQVPMYALIRDEKNSGTNGGTLTITSGGTWNVRVLNTIETNMPELVSISNNRIILQPSNYLISCSAPASQVDYHQIRLQCITGYAGFSGTLSYGSNAFSAQTFNVGLDVISQTESKLDKILSIMQPVSLEIHHRAKLMTFNPNPGNVGGGLAMGFGGKEIYTTVKIQKI